LSRLARFLRLVSNLLKGLDHCLLKAKMCAIVIHEITLVYSLIRESEAGALPPGLPVGLFVPDGPGSSSAPDPFHGQKAVSTMVSRQLELGFGSQPGCRSAGRRRGRVSRAHWWFERMGGLVNGAPDWEPAALPEEAPRPTGVQAKPDLLKSDASPRTVSPGPAISTPEFQPALKAPRWKFART
jgi:hypothetical protein